jgi:hypothetical protein
MRTTLLAVLGIAVIAQIASAQAAPAELPCNRTLAGEAAAVASFTTPTKPTQAYVTGLHGRRIPTTEWRFMQAEIRRAAQDCENGNEAAVIERVGRIQTLMRQLAAAAPSSIS